MRGLGRAYIYIGILGTGLGLLVGAVGFITSLIKGDVGMLVVFILYGAFAGWGLMGMLELARILNLTADPTNNEHVRGVRRKRAQAMSIFRIDVIDKRSTYIEAPDFDHAVQQWKGSRDPQYVRDPTQLTITELQEKGTHKI